MARRRAGRLGGDAFLQEVVLRPLAAEAESEAESESESESESEAEAEAEAESEAEAGSGAARRAGRYPFSIPAVRALAEPLVFDPRVTFLVGENGSGKSTLLEALAVAAGFNAEGGTKNFSFATRPSHSALHRHLLVAWGRRPKDGFFFRGESFYTVATYLEQIGGTTGYGGSLHERSHGEAFLALVTHRFGGDGLYLLDEPESALSPARLLSLLAAIHALVRRGSQVVAATHSPMLLAYPGATIYALGPHGIRRTTWAETEHVQVTRDFLAAPERYLKHLFEAVEAQERAASDDDDAPRGRRRRSR
ncbi:MAG: AAA family ATPase [Planctomycetes bacterium]|nr:AAA family ATPase [Planctomycetota bacterium]